MEEVLNNKTKGTGMQSIIAKACSVLAKHYPFLLQVLLLHMVRAIAICGALMFVIVDQPQSPLILLIVLFLLGQISAVEFLAICLKLSRSQSAQLFEMQSLAVYLRWFLVTSFFVVCFLLGIIFALIPGLVIAILFSTYGFAILDGHSAVNSVKTSIRIARPVFFQILVLGAIITIPELIFSSPLLVGISIALEFVLILSLAEIYINGTHNFIAAEVRNDG
ncbi:hypothetical protein BH11CYA1_BH11CYA1_23890 [soil metagenome]